jgi:hypothetical protein
MECIVVVIDIMEDISTPLTEPLYGTAWLQTADKLFSMVPLSKIIKSVIWLPPPLKTGKR